MDNEATLLDNPMWHALHGHQSSYAVGNEVAKRFQHDVDWFASFASLDSPNWSALANYVEVKELLLTPKLTVPSDSGFRVLGEAELKQYVYRAKSPPSEQGNGEIAILAQADLAEIAQLIHETDMHPLQPRTIQLGQYLGVRLNNKLVAMAGERMHIGPYREIGNVCTSPGYTGRGLASSLVSLLIARIRGRNEIPILHVGNDNSRAISIYEKLGFVYRKPINVQVVEYVGM